MVLCCFPYDNIYVFLATFTNGKKIYFLCVGVLNVSDQDKDQEVAAHVVKRQYICVMAVICDA